MTDRIFFTLLFEVLLAGYVVAQSTVAQTTGMVTGTEVMMTGTVPMDNSTMGNFTTELSSNMTTESMMTGTVPMDNSTMGNFTTEYWTESGNSTDGNSTDSDHPILDPILESCDQTCVILCAVLIPLGALGIGAAIGWCCTRG